MPRRREGLRWVTLPGFTLGVTVDTSSWNSDLRFKLIKDGQVLLETVTFKPIHDYIERQEKWYLYLCTLYYFDTPLKAWIPMALVRKPDK